MSQKHTPGPWHMGEGNGEGSIFKTGEGRMRFEQPGGTTLYPICAMVRGWNDQEDEANARLIAAAPEMLEALRLAEPELREDLEAHVRSTAKRLAFRWCAGMALPSAFDTPQNASIAAEKAAAYSTTRAAIDKATGGTP